MLDAHTSSPRTAAATPVTGPAKDRSLGVDVTRGIALIAFYPQFVPADRPLFATTAVLALLQVLIETVLYLGLAAGVARAGGWFHRPVVRARLEAVSGTVLVALGLRVAVSPR